jgi:hypothetical protein
VTNFGIQLLNAMAKLGVGGTLLQNPHHAEYRHEPQGHPYQTVGAHPISVSRRCGRVNGRTGRQTGMGAQIRK